jgi:hypothetical protein
MTISNAITLDEVLSAVRDNEIEVAHLAGDIRTAKTKLEAAKLPSYVSVLAFLGSNCGTDPKGFRKFWTVAMAGSFKAGLQAKGVTPACAKRLSENSTNAFKANADLRKAACEGAAEVSQWLEANKVTTEKAIKALGGKPPADPDEALSRKLADMEAERFSKIVDRVRVLKEINLRKTNGPNGVSKPGKAVPEVVASE